MNRFGTENYDHRQFSQLCDQFTGGLDVSSHVCAHYNDLMTMEQGVLFSSYALDDNLPYMLNLWEDIFCRSIQISNGLACKQICMYVCMYVHFVLRLMVHDALIRAYMFALTFLPVM